MSISTILAGVLTESVFAFNASDAIDAVGGPSAANLPSGGGMGFGGILYSVAYSFIPIAAVAALLAMTIAGFFLALSGSETQTTTARRVFISSLAGLALMNLVDVFASSLISKTFGVDPASLAPIGGPTILTDPWSAGDIIAGEARDLIAFLEVPLGILCVVMIIVSGIRAIANFGSEDGVAQLRRTVLFTVAGFILVYMRSTFVAGNLIAGGGIAFGSPMSTIHIILLILNRIYFYVFILAVVMIIYAGILMIVNIGKDEQYSRAKSLIIRVAIGLLVIVASGGIVYLLTSIAPQPAIIP